MAPVLEVRNITKRIPGVLANDQISFTLEKGEIHAFLGENGARLDAPFPAAKAVHK